jgi:hypothetical protein
MSEEIDYDRRRFLGTAVMTLAASGSDPKKSFGLPQRVMSILAFSE